MGPISVFPAGTCEIFKSELRVVTFNNNIISMLSCVSVLDRLAGLILSYLTYTILNLEWYPVFC